jgi:hypothetical protein
VFVVPQVDGEGYVQTDVFVEAVKKLFTEDRLKSLVETWAPDCVTKANAHAKGRYKDRFSSKHSVRN